MSAELWYYVHDGATVGPLSRDAIDALIHAGTMGRETLVSPGGADWIAAGSSALSSSFGQGPTPTPVAPSPRWVEALKDRRLRVMIGIGLALGGAYQMRDGIGMLGKKELPGDMSVRFLGCTAVSAVAMQCGFQNSAQAERAMCMDVVILCNDGRHVASSCSDVMQPGAFTMKVVDNFTPAVNATLICPNVAYENVKTKG